MNLKVTVWNNTYDNQWSGLIVPEAFSHPAKFSPGLIQKIYAYGLESGWFKPGDLIGDCFGGIGGGGIFAAYARLRWIGVELESKFVELAGQNFELHRATWAAHGYPEPVIVQGDSRRFSEIIGKCAGIITSPPYAEGLGHDSGHPRLDEQEDNRRKADGCARRCGYNSTPGQIGKLKAGSLDAIATSPPFCENPQSYEKLDGKNLSVRKNPRQAGEKLYFTNYHQPDSPGQIGRLKAGELAAICTSPPYAEGIGAGEGPNSTWRNGQKKNKTEIERRQLGTKYGPNPSNIGNLKMAGIVTSPPFEDRVSIQDREFYYKKCLQTGRNPESGHTKSIDSYGDSSGQIWNEKSESYWEAMFQVYSECHKALKPGGYLIVVVKSYIKNKRKVHLPQQTLKLLIRLGFHPVERIKAMLVKQSVNAGLFGDDIITEKARKSFFRRLAEAKGSPKIDWEEIMVVRKLKTP